MPTKLKEVITYYDDDKTKIKKRCLVDENGNKQGPYEFYHDNGQLREKCTYKGFNLDGSYEEYYLNGQLKVRGAYINGEFMEGEEAYQKAVRK